MRMACGHLDLNNVELFVCLWNVTRRMNTTVRRNLSLYHIGRDRRNEWMTMVIHQSWSESSHFSLSLSRDCGFHESRDPRSFLHSQPRVWMHDSVVFFLVGEKSVFLLRCKSFLGVGMPSMTKVSSLCDWRSPTEGSWRNADDDGENLMKNYA